MENAKNVERALFADKLRTLRCNRGYTQEFVANSLGVDRVTYLLYETGTKTPDASITAKLSEMFETEL